MKNGGGALEGAKDWVGRWRLIGPELERLQLDEQRKADLFETLFSLSDVNDASLLAHPPKPGVRRDRNRQLFLRRNETKFLKARRKYKISLNRKVGTSASSVEINYNDGQYPHTNDADIALMTGIGRKKITYGHSSTDLQSPRIVESGRVLSIQEDSFGQIGQCGNRYFARSNDV